ncbi:MAG: 50S ribosomal protein L11 methyltransferase [Candidatus Limnocylindrales bacterium]
MRSGRPAQPPRATGAWLELSVRADVEAVEAVSEILARVAPGGVTVEPAFELVDDGLGARIDPARPAVVRAYLPLRSGSGEASAEGSLEASAEAAVTQVRTALGHLQAFGLRPLGDLATRTVHEADWAAAWKVHFPVLHVGRRLVIRPTWRRHRPVGDEVVIALDPGMAFGTGLHPTTRLCLSGLEALADGGRLAGATVLDVGCGSGIHGLAALGLGAARVLGLDTDPLAVEATRANARRNRVARRVRAEVGSLPAPGGPYEVVVANLIASLLVTLTAALAAALRPGDGRPGRGGVLLAGGIFRDREPEVRRGLAAAGLRILRRWDEGDWVTLEAERIA